jgi:putative SOS response-associated peptidase YedK
MCGRYVQTKSARDHARLLATHEEMEAPRPETWNLAPSTPSLIVRAKPDGLTSSWLSWGFQSSTTAAVKPINARIETAASKSLFMEAWKTRRCVVPADGWYEWKEERNRKQPYYFYQKNGEPLFFAGLWTGESFAILTTAAVGDLARIHDRRPLAFGVERGREWIEQLPQSEGSVVARAVSSAEIALHPVSTSVSSPHHDGPELIQMVAVCAGFRQDELL